jgi:long-subunit fatty acid transport protein
LAYFFGKRGLLSADVEMVNFSGMYVASAELGPYANQQFKDKYNTQMSRNFQTALNMKVGAEFRLTPSWTLRGGVASYGNGFSSTYDSIDRSQFQLSGGLGYRSSTYYVDLAFVQRSGKDAYTPYALKNAADYASAALNITQTQISLGGGLFF